MAVKGSKVQNEYVKQVNELKRIVIQKDQLIKNMHKQQASLVYSYKQNDGQAVKLEEYSQLLSQVSSMQKSHQINYKLKQDECKELLKYQGDMCNEISYLKKHEKALLVDLDQMQEHIESLEYSKQ